MMPSVRNGTRLLLRSAILATALLAACGGDSPTAPTPPSQPPVDAFTLVLRERAGQQLEGSVAPGRAPIRCS